MPSWATRSFVASLMVGVAGACGGKVFVDSGDAGGNATQSAGTGSTTGGGAGGTGGAGGAGGRAPGGGGASSGGQGDGGSSSGGQGDGGSSSGGPGMGGSGAGGQGDPGYTIAADGTCWMPIGTLAPGCPMVLPPPCSWAQGGLTFGEFLCELPFDTGPNFDPTQLDYVDVYFGAGYLQGGRLLRVAGASACNTTGNGWYFDDAKAPTKILICPNACACGKGQPGTFYIVEGCWANAAPGVLDAQIPCPHCAKARDTTCQGSPTAGYGGIPNCEVPLQFGFNPAYTNVKYVQHGAVAGPAEPWDGYLTFVKSLADCDKVEEGWTLDVSTQPPTIRVCPSACSCVKVSHASLMVEGGCQRHELGP